MLEEKDLQAIAQLIDASLDAKLDAKLAPINDRLDQMQATQAQMQDDQKQIREDLAHVKARLDYDVDKKLDAINEGIDTIRETMVSKSRVEQLEDDVIVLKTAFKAMSQRIAELEKVK